jgi:GntR family transcriptional regulator
VVSGKVRPGEPFPSVRALSREFKINPNTAHKVVTRMIAEGLLEVRVGVGTVVAAPRPSTAAARSQLLKGELEELVVEAKQLGMDLDDVLQTFSLHWKRLGGGAERVLESCKKGRAAINESIRCAELSKRFRKVRAVDRLNLTVRAGADRLRLPQP